jgi:SAM-dependent methyltransferase
MPDDVTSQNPTLARGSPDRFGYEWAEYAEINSEHEVQFRRWTPFFQPEDWKGKTVLDVGCGMGRNSYWPLTYGAASVTAIDVDDRTLASARSTLARFDNAEVRKASAYAIGTRAHYDIVFSIGVIHHLEDPDRALAQMRKAAKPGGQVLIWVYGLENNEWIVRYFDPLRKALFAKLPVGVVHHLSIYPSAALWAVLRLGLSRIEYFRLIRTFGYRHLRAIVFDQMLPKIARYWSRQEVETLMRNAGLQDVRTEWVNEMSWAAIGKRLGDSTASKA